MKSQIQGLNRQPTPGKTSTYLVSSVISLVKEMINKTKDADINASDQQKSFDTLAKNEA